ncbi:DUF1697 domain-containing protein [Maribacter sp. 2304DJ31-5]|uniref:DUF1697 domain-containing protein n=1 Tax=Maribacter sp. 2304DJ31-5 TaxID=3386273 RepID=UPI0039BCE4E7
MDTYIAFLRGINVGGHKKVPMAQLRNVLENEGFSKVRTYIQSGNVVFESDLDSKRALEELIAQSIEKHFGFEVPVLIRTVKEIHEILANNPFDNDKDLANNRIYFVLLSVIPEPKEVACLREEHYVNEQFKITDTCVYLCCKKGYGQAKLSSNLIERKLKVKATARNFRTMQKLLELSNR